MSNGKKQVYFGSGCFWCTEAVYQQLKGVLSVEPGYSGGDVDNPDYRAVSTGKTGHAEMIKLEYDPDIITYDQLLSVFFSTHDPTSLNKQGGDIGSQYRSLILFTDNEQKKQAQDFITKLTQDKVYKKPIVTDIKEFKQFYPAEKEHHEYYNKNKKQPYCLLVINPKLKKLKENYKDLLK